MNHRPLELFASMAHTLESCRQERGQLAAMAAAVREPAPRGHPPWSRAARIFLRWMKLLRS